MIDALFEGLKFVVVIAFASVAFTQLARHGCAPFGFRFSVRRRRLVLFVLALLAVAVEVGEEVVEGETARIDEGILLFLKASAPAGTIPFFEVVSLSGSGGFLAPVVVGVSGLLVVAQRVREAILLAASSGVGAIVIWGLKRAVGRDRPALWETRWYWGSSFPSGHTLAAACVATSLVVCAARLSRGGGDRNRAMAIRLFVGVFLCVWAALVGLSRLVLGVHWPTDVLAAACLGISIPFLVEVVIARWLRDEGGVLYGPREGRAQDR